MEASAAMVKVPLKYLTEDRDRHGNLRLYFRRKGQPKIRLEGPLGSEAFMESYRKALEGTPARPVVSAADARDAPQGSLRWLVAAYVGSPEFLKLDAKTRVRHRKFLESICARVGKVTGKPLGLGPARAIEERHVYKWRDEVADRPGTARHRMQAMRAFFKWAVARKHLAHNPAKDVPILTWASDGFHSWTIGEVEQYEARHPIGTRARLALALLLYTGQRISDVAVLGIQHRRDDAFTFTQMKGRNRKPVTLTIPLIWPLREIIDATPRPANARSMAYLLTQHGHAFSVDGLRNKMRQWCDEAGLPHCSAHGLRKALLARAAELELTAFEIGAISGHVTLDEIERYTRAARQKKLAASGMAKIEAGFAREGEARTKLSHFPEGSGKVGQ